MSKPVLKKRFAELSSTLEPIETPAIPVLKKLQDIRVIAYDFYGTLFISGVGDIGIDDGKSDPTVMLDALKNADIDILDNEIGLQGFQFYNQIVEKEILQLKKKQTK